MRSRSLRRAAWPVALGLATVAGLVWLALPRAVPVETAAVDRGEVTVTVRDEGKTRIRDRFTVASPLAGLMARIVLDEGDPVRKGETVLASITPREPSLLDPRAREEAEARVRAADAEFGRAKAMLVHANALLESAEDELLRARRTSQEGALSVQELERAESAGIVARAARDAASFAVENARFGLDLARAALVRGDGDATGWTLDIRSPADGVLLRKFHESETPVETGTPLVEIGDPADLEVVIDCLSTDAVRVRPGDPAAILAWGGPDPLAARVRLVEPSAFTEISALGVEEQRVNVVLDLVAPRENRTGLGDAFRVEAEITVDRAADAVRAPVAALVPAPDGSAWGTFVVDRGRATWRPVEIGLRGTADVEIRRGLAPGDRVIVYPADRVTDGVRVAPREATRSATARSSGTWSKRS